MDVISVLLSGIGGALLGVAGAYVIQRQHDRDERRGAARALWAEAIQNATVLAMMADGWPPEEIRDGSWQRVQVQVALLLAPRDFKAVSAPYLAGRHTALTVAEALEAGGATPEHVAGWREQATDFDTAVQILKTYAWSVSERVELHNAGSVG